MLVNVLFLSHCGRHPKDQSSIIHQGLAVSLILLNLLFFFTGVLANVGGESMCVFVAAALHYALLMSLAWMGIEVFHTFWMIYMVFSPRPKPYVWNIVGFGEFAIYLGHMTSWIIHSPRSDCAFFLFSRRPCHSCSCSCCSRWHLWHEKVATLWWHLRSLSDVRFFKDVVEESSSLSCSKGIFVILGAGWKTKTRPGWHTTSPLWRSWWSWCSQALWCST